MAQQRWFYSIIINGDVLKLFKELVRIIIDRSDGCLQGAVQS